MDWVLGHVDPRGWAKIQGHTGTFKPGLCEPELSLQLPTRLELSSTKLETHESIVESCENIRMGSIKQE